MIHGVVAETLKISDMMMQLFPSIPREQISVFSCGHVIPDSSLHCVVLGSGPRGKDLEFKFKNRDDQSLVCSVFHILRYLFEPVSVHFQQIEELGQCLFNIASVSRFDWSADVAQDNVLPLYSCVLAEWLCSTHRTHSLIT